MSQAYTSQTTEKKVVIPDKLSIDRRGDSINDKEGFGDRKMDTLIGKEGKGLS